MDSPNFDTVKAEKANAIARYRRFRSIAKLLQIFEVFAALTLISWSSTRLPSAVKISGEFLLKLSVYILNPHVVFLIGNAIVITLFVLSRQNEAENNAVTSDFCDYYVRNSEIQYQTAPASEADLTPSPPPTTEETSGDEKQIVCSENAAYQRQCDAVATAIEKATKQIQRFQRTQSEKLKREISVKRFRELRRSETEICRIVVASDDRRRMTSFDTVDSLSNEEFRHAIEAFIEKRQRFLLAQKMADKNQ